MVSANPGPPGKMAVKTDRELHIHHLQLVGFNSTFSTDRKYHAKGKNYFCCRHLFQI